jgi:hypothetical protein
MALHTYTYAMPDTVPEARPGLCVKWLGDPQRRQKMGDAGAGKNWGKT